MELAKIAEEARWQALTLGVRVARGSVMLIINGFGVYLSITDTLRALRESRARTLHPAATPDKQHPVCSKIVRLAAMATIGAIEVADRALGSPHSGRRILAARFVAWAANQRHSAHSSS